MIPILATATTLETVLAFVVTLMTASGGGFALLKFYIKSRMEQKSFRNVTSNIADLYDVLQEARGRLGAERILVVKAHNGGGPPRVTSPLKSSILYEVYDEKVAPLKPGWQDQPSDEQFVRVIKRLDETKTLRLGFNGHDVTPGARDEMVLDGPGNIANFYATTEVLTSDAMELKTVEGSGYYYLVVDRSALPEDVKGEAEYKNTLREVHLRVKSLMWPEPQ